jgi:hypothetical protein
VDSLWGYVATGVVSVAVGLLLRELAPKVRLVFWVPHSFVFEIPIPDNPVAHLVTHAITIQNIGRKTAQDLEIVLRRRPDFFKLQPALDYVESDTPAGEHVIRLRSLGPREFFTFEFLSWASHPEITAIRCLEGPALPITVQAFRPWSRWALLVGWGLMLTGFGFWFFWLLRVGAFILHGIGIVP